MLNKLKSNEKLLELIMTIVFGVIASFYIVYKLSNSIFMVIVGLIILTFGYFMKDPEVKKEEKSIEQLTIFSEEVLAPSVIINKEKIKKSKRVKA